MRIHKSTHQKRPIRRAVRLAVVVALVGIVGAACSGTEEVSDIDGVTVIATTTIWADVASVIVGDEGTVSSLMPVGVDPHDFRLSASQVGDVVAADLVIANGLGLEQGLIAVFESAASDGANIVEVGPAANPVSFGDRSGDCDDPSHDGAGHDDADASVCDPHVWMDPNRVALAASVIADALAEVAPDGHWRERADAYILKLGALSGEMALTLDAVEPSRRHLVTNHDSLGYLADRFDFDVIATVIPGGSTLANPSSSDLAALVATMRSLGVGVIFADTSDSTKLAEAVAAELGEDVTVVELHTGSLGDEGSGAETLIDMLQLDAALIATALS